jgi:hypothetical protein
MAVEIVAADIAVVDIAVVDIAAAVVKARNADRTLRNSYLFLFHARNCCTVPLCPPKTVNSLLSRPGLN